MEFIINTFCESDAKRILSISLSRFPHEDYQVWKGEASREFLVRSAYKSILQQSTEPTHLYNQIEHTNFYKKLWGLNLPLKLKITIWCFSKKKSYSM